MQYMVVLQVHFVRLLYELALASMSVVPLPSLLVAGPRQGSTGWILQSAITRRDRKYGVEVGMYIFH